MSDIFYLLLFKSKHQIHSQISSILIKIVITATLLFPFFFLADPAQNDLIKIRNLHHQLAGCLIWFWQVATKDKHYQSIFWSSSLWPCVRQYVVNSLVLDLWCFSSRKVRRVSKCLKLHQFAIFSTFSGLINHAGGGERRVLRGMRLRPALSGPRAAHRRRSPGRRGQGVRRPKVIFRGQSQRHGMPYHSR